MNVATLMASHSLTDAQIAETAQQLASFGATIEKTTRLSVSAADLYFSLPLEGRGGERGVQQELHLDLSAPLDLLIQPASTRRKKILVADMESTMIEQEMLDELGAMIGIGDRVAAITARAMNGELDFPAALAERVALLKGQPESLLREAAAHMSPMPGARELLAAFKRAGGKCWLVSGGFTFFIKIIAEMLGFDRYFGNDLLVEDGVIAGQTRAPILDGLAKKRLLEQSCADYGCNLSDAVALGDGANDIPMLQACHAGGGLAVACRAKPKLRALIPNQLNRCDLSALLYAMGMH